MYNFVVTLRLYEYTCYTFNFAHADTGTSSIIYYIEESWKDDHDYEELSNEQ